MNVLLGNPWYPWKCKPLWWGKLWLVAFQEAPQYIYHIYMFWMKQCITGWVLTTFLWLHCSALGQHVRKFLVSWPQYICALLHFFNFRIIFGVNTKSHTCCLFYSVISCCPSTDFKRFIFLFYFFVPGVKELQRREWKISP